MDHRRLRTLSASAIVAALTIAGLTGCGSTKQYSDMAQQTSSAASSVRSVAVALQLESSGKGLPSITDTSVDDAVTKLVDADGSLTSMDVTGPERRQRDRALSEVRIAEAAMLSVRADLSAARNSALGRRGSLVSLASALNRLTSSLESR